MIGIGTGILVFNACATKGYFQAAPGQPLCRRRLLVSWNLLTLPAIPIVVIWLVIRICLKKSGRLITPLPPRPPGTSDSGNGSDPPPSFSSSFAPRCFCPEQFRVTALPPVAVQGAVTR